MSKCAESLKSSMPRPPKMPKVLKKVEDLVKKCSAKGEPQGLPEKPEEYAHKGLFIGKTRYSQKRGSEYTFGRSLDSGPNRGQHFLRPDCPGRAAFLIPRNSRAIPAQASPYGLQAACGWLAPANHALPRGGAPTHVRAPTPAHLPCHLPHLPRLPRGPRRIIGSHHMSPL